MPAGVVKLEQNGEQNVCPVAARPRKKGNAAADRVSVFAGDASYKQTSVSNLLHGEPLATRLNGVINYCVFFIIVFLCH